MKPRPDVLIVGAGVFGLAAALELQRRGASVRVVSPGPIPHPLAASTDISKVVRLEYGSDLLYMEMVEASLPIFRSWNDGFAASLYHETGVSCFTTSRMAPGGFEYESYHALLSRGHRPARVSSADIARRFPAWQSAGFVDGFWHAEGGYVESGKLMTALAGEADRLGAQFVDGKAVQVLNEGNRATGILLQSGERLLADTVIVAAGAWSTRLVPDLAPYMKVSGHPVMHLQPADPTRFCAPDFSVFLGDVARTGWYGFPLHPSERVVKIGRHSIGVRIDPDLDERIVYASDERELRGFLRSALPSLADAPIVYSRRCLYLDTLDGHFWIDRHPQIDGLIVATGGSGHAMKFAPVLGALVADAVEARPNSWLSRFRWRHLAADAAGKEAARHGG